jgi:drug/metabolite transporter (DMT)-like permease
MFLSWFPLVLFYIATNSSSKIMQKMIIKNDQVDFIAFSAIFQFFPGLLTLPFIFCEPIRFPDRPMVWGALVASCLGYTFCMVFYYYSMKRIEVSQVETLGTTRSIWGVVLGVFFFGEVLSISKVVGVALIVAAIVVVYSRKSKHLSVGLTKPHFAALLYALIISSNFALDKFALGYFSVTLYQTLIYIIPAGLTLLVFPVSAQKVLPSLRVRKNLWLMVFCFVCQAVSTLALYRAYQVGGELSVVGPISQVTTLVTISFGIIFLQERWNLRRKLVGVFLAFAGILCLRFFVF